MSQREPLPVYNVGVIVGSLSEKSINRHLFHALATLGPGAQLSLVEIPIADLRVYNRDFDADYPAEARALKSAIEASDAIILVTPEYNRSLPASLKNAIDWASRPWGTNSFNGKPSAVIGTSPGKTGTAMAQAHLRNILSHLGSPELGQPEAFIQNTPGLFGENGEISDDTVAEFLLNWLKAFHTHTARSLAPVQ